MIADDAVFTIDRNAREVADVLIRPSQPVEQRGLAAVLIANKGEREGVPSENVLRI